jgi:hypothetical protein
MKFLSILQFLTPLLGALLSQAIPGLHPAAVPHIIAGITGAESLAAGSGIDKKRVAIQIAQDGLEAAQAQGVPFDAGTIAQDVPAAVQLGVDVINALHKHTAVNPADTTMTD